ncbi:hypothetical protein MPSEU_000186500 [Mayamaea pseudoterrestris]|nr:hypothetical protein MPSEU_000186500 [Mayamaea pseudoterrestris]
MHVYDFNSKVASLVLLLLMSLEGSKAFVASSQKCFLDGHRRTFASSASVQAISEQSIQSSSETKASASNLLQAKQDLLHLLPRMTGQADEFRRVEQLVNTLENQYQPAQTLQFLNFAMQGDWQLLFSTNLAGLPMMNPNIFRLREQYQRAACNGLEGTLQTEATWDFAQAQAGIFDVSGTFQVTSRYKITQGARMVVQEQPDHVLTLAQGSAVPNDAQALVGMLHRSMPKELFDASEHGIDPTYLDADLKIVRYTGPRLEGVRDIFIRRGSLVVDPTAS